jgi:catechol 2,3-dioxygenase-like lactoylglutathione lyase family enzyme
MGETAVMEPLGVHHVSVNVGDVEGCARFYIDVLGGRRRDDRPDFGFGGAWIDLGDQQLHLIEAPTPPNLGQHFAVQVADIAAVVAELRGRGCEVTEPVQVATNLQAFLEDPAGNVIELHQVGAPA